MQLRPSPPPPSPSAWVRPLPGMTTTPWPLRGTRRRRPAQSVSGGADLQIPGSGSVSVRGAAYDFQCSEAVAQARREQRAGSDLLLIGSPSWKGAVQPPPSTPAPQRDDRFGRKTGEPCRVRPFSLGGCSGPPKGAASRRIRVSQGTRSNAAIQLFPYSQASSRSL